MRRYMLYMHVMFLLVTFKYMLLFTSTPSRLLAVHRYVPSSFFETAPKTMLSELWPGTKPSDIFSIFGAILYHVMVDSGLLETLQFNQPAVISTNTLDKKVTSGESSRYKTLCSLRSISTPCLFRTLYLSQ